MVRELLEQQVLMYVMLGMTAAGFLLKLALSITAGRFLSASRHMADTGNKLFKLMRLKFEACYKLKISIRNAEAFVDKYITSHRIFGMTLESWAEIGELMTFLCMCVGVSGTLLGIMEGCSLNLVLQHFGLGLLCAAFLHVVDGLSALGIKGEQMRANAIDYFDNFLRARLENEYLHPEKMADYQQAYFEKESAGTQEEEMDQAQEKTAREERYINPVQQPSVSRGSRNARSAGAQEGRREPVPAKRRRQPEMYVSPEEEVAAGQETVSEQKEGKYSDQGMIARSIEEVEKEKIIEDILKEYLV